jgi:hypothetical protein
MKSLLLTLFLSTSLLAQELPVPLAPQKPSVTKEVTLSPVTQSTPYATLGLGPCPIPLPTFGLGYRKQIDHHGFDLSLQGTTVIEMSALKFSTLYNYYFKPNLSSQFYTGFGLGTGAFFNHRTTFFLSPELTFGKQYQNESHDTRFFQAEISFPTFSFSKHQGYYRTWEDTDSSLYRHEVTLFPLVVLTYGIGF